MRVGEGRIFPRHRQCHHRWRLPGRTYVARAHPSARHVSVMRSARLASISARLCFAKGLQVFERHFGHCRRGPGLQSWAWRGGPWSCIPRAVATPAPSAMLRARAEISVFFMFGVLHIGRDLSGRLIHVQREPRPVPSQKIQAVLRQGLATRLTQIRYCRCILHLKRPMSNQVAGARR